METETLPNSSQLQKFLKIFLLLFVLCLPLLFFSEFLNQRVFFFQKATAGNPSFSFNPSSLTVNQGEEFLVEIKINTENEQTSGASAQIAFDNQVFEAKETIPGKDISQAPAMFPNVLRNKIDNSVGKVFLDAGVDVANPQYYVGEGIFGKIKFKVKDQANPGNNTISFYLSNPTNPKALGDCDIVGANQKAGQDLLGEINNLTVSISSSISPTPSTSPTPTNTPIPGQPTNTPIPTPTSTPIPSTPTPEPTEIPESPEEPTETPSPTPLTTNTPQPTSTLQPTSSPAPTLPPNSSGLIADISGMNNQKDGRVNIYDFNVIMAHWNETENISQYDVSGPQNQPDGKIDFYDFVKILVYWSP